MPLDRFLIKRASLSTILPAVAGPALGAFGGRALGPRMGFSQDIGALLGGITGGTVGQLMKEKAEDPQQVPPGAPFALDATTADIPPWAVQGAQMIQPKMKQANEREPVSDVLLGEVPGFNVVQQGIQHGPSAAARTFGGMAGGGLVGGGIGALGGYGLEKLLGRHVDVPGIGMSLPDLLASVGGTIGATKGLRHMKA